MIYLITGTPGTGKTSLAVEWILSNYDGLFEYEAEDGTKLPRPLYFCHIDGLDTQKFKAHELTEQEIQAAPLNEIVPTGSVVIVDECDYTYPLRSAAKAVPSYVQTLKELRHDGFTLILMTQHPSMLDSYVRRLVSKHIHLERKQFGTKKYEWNRVCENLTATEFANAPSSFYKPSKRAFKYYKSASLHIKFTRKKHWIFYALPVIFIVFAWLIWSIVSGWQEEADPVSDQPPAAASEPYPAVASLVPVAYQASADEKRREVIDQLQPYHFRPRIANMAETAPIYDVVRKVTDFPRIAGCVDSGKRCRCYTQQGSVYQGIDDAECRSMLEEPVFDPYRQPNLENEGGLRDLPQMQSDGNSRPFVGILGNEPKISLTKQPDLNLARD